MTHICPYCGEPAIARIRPITSQQLSVQMLYRHEVNGWVYLHWMSAESLPGCYDAERSSG